VSLDVAVVTGASSGIGEALVRALQARGVRVVGIARRPSRADEHEECDVADRAALEAVAERVLARHPRIDLLVANAGLSARTAFLDAEPSEVERVIAVNYLGSVWTLRAFLPGLGTGSHLVNVVSVAGLIGYGPYSASKHAQLAFSRSVTVELAPRGISVHTVNPGYVETPGFPQRENFGPLLGRIVAEPELVARRILAAVDHDRPEVVVPRWYAPVGWLQGVAPSPLLRLRSRFGK
jgi:NAD(P)-dependent dehydrogenase (short-subunit alcohol dehydrogenase family)